MVSDKTKAKYPLGDFYSIRLAMWTLVSMTSNQI